MSSVSSYSRHFSNNYDSMEALIALKPTHQQKKLQCCPMTNVSSLQCIINKATGDLCTLSAVIRWIFVHVQKQTVCRISTTDYTEVCWWTEIIYHIYRTSALQQFMLYRVQYMRGIAHHLTLLWEIILKEMKYMKYPLVFCILLDCMNISQTCV